MKHARVETLENNEKARGLYPKLDFEEVARRIYYFREL
jgi:ribosomal protein S18 acetylase RimI-like enzyme